MRVLVTGVAAATLAACGGGGADSDGFSSGSRLRAMYLEGDSARLFTGFYDVALEVPCTFEVLPGQDDAYCLPAAPEAFHFVDPDCTQPVYDIPRETSGEDPPQYVRVTADACDASPRMWRIGPPVQVEWRYARWGDGGCYADALGTTGAVAIAELPIERFAHATVEVARGDTRLRERVLVGGDGARQRVGYVDAELEVDCTVQDRYGTGMPACLPRMCGDSSDVWDATCMRRYALPSVAERDCRCAPSRFAEFYDDFETGGAAIVRMVAPVAADTPIASRAPLANGGWACYASSYAHEGLFETVDVSFAPAQPQVEGSGRIRAIEYVVGDDATPSGFFDAELDTRCTPAHAGDGTVRCIPHARSSISVRYLDDGCMQPVQLVPAWGPRGRTVAATGEAPWEIDYPSSSSVSPAPRLYEVGELPSAQLYWGWPGACFPYVFDPAVEPWRVVGPELPPERFALLTTITEWP